MKKYLALLLLISSTYSVFSQGMKFEDNLTWVQVLEKAKVSGKPIFVDAYTTWCGPCKWMAKNIFPNDSAGAFYNKSYINYKLDMEKGEGIDFARKYQVQSYPTYLFFDKNGELVHRSGGSKPLQSFIGDGMNGINPSKQLYTLEKAYRKGADFNITRDYALALAEAGEESPDVAKAYLAAVPENEKFSETTLTILATHAPLKSNELNFLIENKNNFISVKPHQIDELIMSKYDEAIRIAGRQKNINEFNALLPDIKSSFGKLKATEAEMKYYKYAKDFANEFKLACTLFKSPDYKNAAEMNSFAWKIYEKADATKEQLTTASEWSARSIEIDRQWSYLDTYASLLYKLGDYDKAQKNAVEAIDMARANNEDPKETEALLEKINRKIQSK